MLKVRRTQIEVFSELSCARFEERMLTHLGQFFPTQCEALGQRQLGEIIQSGIRSAATYGIVAERDVCLYIDAMILSGRHSSIDHNLPWAQEILHGVDARGAGPTAALLYDMAELISHQTQEH